MKGYTYSFPSPTREIHQTRPNNGMLRSFNSNCNADDITIKVLGEFGKWQLWISIYMAILRLPYAWYQLNIIFMAPPQEFWCAKPEFLIMYTEEEWREICSPKMQEHPCMIFDPNVLLDEPYMDRALIPLVPCRHFIYDISVFNRTIVSDWNLVCSKHWLIHFTQCTMMWGVVFGSIIFGILADKHGRKTPIMIGITLQCIMSFITSIAPSYWSFLISWFILAIACGGVGIISFVISMEVVGGKWRTIIPILNQLPFGLGNTIMAALAYWLRDWRKLEFALATLSTIFLIYWLLLPESPRWLIATGKNKKALDILEKGAIKNNRKKFFDQMKHHLIVCKAKKGNGPGFMAFMRFCTGLAFYTFSQYLGLIGGNIFLTIALSGVISVSGSICCLIVVTRYGRKTTVWIFQLLTAFCFASILFIPKIFFKNDWPRLLFGAIGFAGLSGSVPALYLYSGELFPTLGRNAGVAGVTMFARIASMVAPAVVSLNEIKADLPLVLLGIMSFVQLALLVPLPETKGQPLPDTLAQAEQFNKRKSTSTSEGKK